ncbi:leucine--tRNA ligase [Candidatus Wolfebacteria bacterium]|nr:leucine--tRNA ligase [Candidatus Wolfebacteria bacterium]
MVKKFQPRLLEGKWRRFWEKRKIYAAKDFSRKPKFYGLIEFPYPSGEGLHVGHIRSYTAMDIISRKRRMEGYNVLYPIGWDAFGLPTENYAVRTGIHPKIVTKRNTDIFRRQMKSLGFGFDWDREIATTDPAYYKWTQWIFLQFFKHGLAYKKKIPINWCLSCKIGLANEEVVNGRCERCGGPTEKRDKEQWLLAITKYADRLLQDLDKVDYLEKIKIQQKNWIGKSEGAVIKFEIRNSKSETNPKSKIPNIKQSVEAFTTRPDTLFGATYMVLAPEHEIISQIKNEILNIKEVENYIKKAERGSEFQRTDLTREKTGVELKGIKAVNPATRKEIPIWVADYVLASYGTGAIMAVPSHDARDFAFAKRYGLLIKQVVLPQPSKSQIQNSKRDFFGVYEGEGVLINSGKFNGMFSEKAKREITKFVGGKKESQYHLRDWIFSRQRYWGEPIPLVFCEQCKKQAQTNADYTQIYAEIFPRESASSQRESALSEGEKLNPGWIVVPEKNLPVELPEVKKYKPTDTGESPLAAVTKWVQTKCPKCGGPARRETDTMPNWAGSSWYFLAYIMKGASSNYQLPITNYAKAFRYWTPVDWYNGGMEHTTLHLLYSRFWNKFLYDLGAVPEPEPYKKRTSHGMVLGEGGLKMSKSKGNVVNPDYIVRQFGADTIRLYEMFMGPFDQAIPWDHKGLSGCSRFLNRVWDIAHSRRISRESKNADLERALHQTMKKVGEDIETMSFNTAVSALMIFVNKCHEAKEIPLKIWENFLLILAPFAPFIAEELHQQIKDKRLKIKDFKSVHLEKWPKYNEELIKKDFFELVIQVDGKVRDKVLARAEISQKEAEQLSLNRDKIKQILGGKKIKKIIFVPKRLINIVL